MALTHRRHRGSASFHAGVAAEKRIAQDYERRGFAIARERWRGVSGEIDLVVRDGSGVIFVEVKQSRSFEQAAHHLNQRQMSRIYQTAEEFLGSEPDGSLTEARFDVALVDGQGCVKIIENAFGHF